MVEEVERFPEMAHAWPKAVERSHYDHIDLRALTSVIATRFIGRVSLWRPDASGRSMDAMVSPGSRTKWYYRPAWVLVLLFVVLGPIALPILWRSPSFSRPVKVVLTVLVLAYMALFVDETIRVFRMITSEMDVLGTVTDF